MINVTDDDIFYAEKILLKEGQSFDEERLTFIKDFSTLDVQAVPGSGKTTALLAKLLIIERKMPLDGNSGVLVISHTNAAVNEIKSRIRKFAPKLFQYPNFVGTIQNFVDVFLATPFYVNLFKKKPYRIDNEIYYEQIDRILERKSSFVLKVFLDKQRDGLAFLRSVRWDKDLKLKKGISGDSDNFKLKNPETKTYRSIFNLKMELLEKGYLHFDDAYYLSECQLEDIPNYKKILQSRFKYVFVDEMQDMDIHQYEVLERVFYDNGLSASRFQRIGDVNQAIFNGNSIHINEIWSQRNKTLQISGSHRINKNLAPIIQCLGLNNCNVVGLNKSHNGSEIDIKPHIIIFDDNTKELVIPKFASIIKELQSVDKIPVSKDNLFKAVAWRREHEDEGKLGLSDYWRNISRSVVKKQIDFNVLKDYLIFYDRDKSTLESVRKYILNALLKILRLEDVLYENNRNYSKRQVLNYLKQSYVDEYNNLKLQLYKWSISCINGKIEEVYILIQLYIPRFLSIWGKNVDRSKIFIESNSEIIYDIENIDNSNFYIKDDVNINIGTIHSVKGQTHTATLYLETYFYSDGKGDNAKSYESQRLKSQILGIDITNKKLAKRVQQSLKMAYVGFSRPTHLLCFAVHKERFKSALSEIDQEIWEIVHIDSKE